MKAPLDFEAIGNKLIFRIIILALFENRKILVMKSPGDVKIFLASGGRVVLAFVAAQPFLYSIFIVPLLPGHFGRPLKH